MRCSPPSAKPAGWCRSVTSCASRPNGAHQVPHRRGRHRGSAVPQHQLCFATSTGQARRAGATIRRASARGSSKRRSTISTSRCGTSSVTATRSRCGPAAARGPGAQMACTTTSRSCCVMPAARTRPSRTALQASSTTS
jgi:hypothetical protein